MFILIKRKQSVLLSFLICQAIYIVFFEIEIQYHALKRKLGMSDNRIRIDKIDKHF